MSLLFALLLFNPDPVLMPAPVSLPAATAPATPQEAATPASEAKAEDKAKEKAKERKICRTVSSPGSLLIKDRICMTAAEWKQEEIDLQRSGSRRLGRTGRPE